MKTTSLLTDYFELVNKDYKNEITGVISSDLLSLVMGKATFGNVLVTIQSNVNSVAVATLLDLSCIIITYDYEVGEDVIARAEEEEITIFKTELSTVDAVLQLKELGII